MAAVDSDGKSRLDLAKDRRVRRLIDNLLPEQRLYLISVASSTRRQMTDFTDNQQVLRDISLDLLKSRKSAAGSVKTCGSMTQSPGPHRADQKQPCYTPTAIAMPPDIDFELPFQLNYQKLEPAGRNIRHPRHSMRRLRRAAGTFSSGSRVPKKSIQVSKEPPFVRPSCCISEP